MSFRLCFILRISSALMVLVLFNLHNIFTAVIFTDFTLEVAKSQIVSLQPFVLYYWYFFSYQ